MAIIYRSVKGSALTTGEVDGNFSDLDGRVSTLESTPPEPNEIANITLTGNQLVITLEDATSYTMTVPRASLRWRGEWAASTVYYGSDFFSVDGDGIYLVLQTHTSESTFDAAEADTDGDYYQQILASTDSGTMYDFGFAFAGNPTALEELGRVQVGRDLTIPADFSGSFGAVGTDPDADYEIAVQDDGVQIGTITYHAGTDAGTQTFATTSGTAKSVAAGSVISFVAPDQGTDQDASIEKITAVIQARVA